MEIKKSITRLWSKMGSRAAFGMALTELAKSYDNFYVMSADLAKSSGLTRFRDEFPDRLINIGIQEQNMIGVAGGLAKDGTPVFATSFAPFIAMRASEQVRMNMGYMQLNIKTVALGAGLVMAQLGNSHYGIEDVSVMRSIPGMTVISPADCGEIVKAAEAVINYPKPVYLRLTGGAGNPIVYPEDFSFEIGKANRLREGKDVAFIAAGAMVYQSLEAAKLLEEKNISSTVIDMHTIKPLDNECIDTLLNYKLIVTVEEHTTTGGLGSAVAEYLAPKKIKPPQIMVGIDDIFPLAGSYEYLLEQCGLTGKQIAQRVYEELTLS